MTQRIGHVGRVMLVSLALTLGQLLPQHVLAQGTRDAVAAGEADAEPEQGDYWSDAWRGWFFYERKPKKPPRQATPPAVPAPAAPAASATPPAEAAKAPKHPDLVRFEALQKRVEESRNIAIINPTEENLREFLTAQKLALDTASHFSELSKRVVWATPGLDPTVEGRPTNPDAMSLYDAEQRRQQLGKLAQLSQTHAFFFFFRSDCPYCHRFAPVLRQFSASTGIQVYPISMDGRGLQEFPNFKPDNGIAGQLRVTQVPALFLAEPGSGKVLPVGYGVMSPSELERRIDQITRPGAESAVPSTLSYIGDQVLR